MAPLFDGDVVNVSAWRDEDKEGGHYRDYFSAAKSYSITNWEARARGFQGLPGEIPLDLETPLPPELEGRFDLCFCHTVLEHVFDFHTALDNLCAMSRDLVVLCVPFLQPMHDAHYGDYWRFSPQALERLFADRKMSLPYLSFNSHPKAAVYLFAVATRDPERWSGKIPKRGGWIDPKAPWDGSSPYTGCHAIPNTAVSLRKRLGHLFRKPQPIIPPP